MLPKIFMSAVLFYFSFALYTLRMIAVSDELDRLYWACCLLACLKEYKEWVRQKGEESFFWDWQK